MGNQASIVDEGIGRVQSAFESVEESVEKIQKKAGEEVEKLQDKAEKRASEIGNRARKGVRRVQRELRSNKFYRQAEQRWEEVNKQLEERGKALEARIESGLDSLLGAFQIASRSDVDKLDKKLDRINRRLKALDKTLNKKSAPHRAATSK